MLLEGGKGVGKFLDSVFKLREFLLKVSEKVELGCCEDVVP